MQSSIYSKDKEIFNKVLKLREIQSVDIRFSIAVNSTILLLGFKPVQHSGVSQKRNGTLMKNRPPARPVSQYYLKE